MARKAKDRKGKTIAKGSRNDSPGKGWRNSYKPEYVDQARKLMDMGCTHVEIAKFFGVAVETLRYWGSVRPEFREVLLIKETEANERVKVSLYHLAVGYWVDEEEIKVIEGEIKRVKIKKYYPPNVAAAIYWTKVKCGWRDNEEVLTPPTEDGKTIEGETLQAESKRQIARRIALTLHQGGKAQ